MESRIMKWGNSLAVRIPRSIAAETGLEYGAKVEISANAGAVVVRPATTSVDLKALLKGIKKSNLHAEVSTGRRKGREVW
jgi:antitoxin MazE